MSRSVSSRHAHHRSRLLIGASTGGQTSVSRDVHMSVGIYQGHVFAVLAVHQPFPDAPHFLLLRDPHSETSYSEPLLTEPMRQQLAKVKAVDRWSGTFWIAWKHFLRYFSSLTISTYNSNHFDIRLQGRFAHSFTDHATTYHFNVPQRVPLTCHSTDTSNAFHSSRSSMVTVSLVYHRRDRASNTDHVQTFILCDIDCSTAGRTVIGKRQNILISRRRTFTHWSGSLRAGSYVLVPLSISFADERANHRDFTVVIHSSIALDVETKHQPPSFIADCLISSVMNNPSNVDQVRSRVTFVRSIVHGQRLRLLLLLERQMCLLLATKSVRDKRSRGGELFDAPLPHRRCPDGREHRRLSAFVSIDVCRTSYPSTPSSSDLHVRMD